MPSSQIHPADVSKIQTTLFMLANAMMVHEALAASGAVKDLQPLSGIDSRNPIEWLKQEWDKVLATDYEPIFRPALELLKALPAHPQLAKVLVEMASIAQETVATMAVFKQDLAGRLYHTLLLREIAKSLATYYTSIPAASFLARLAFSSVNTNWEDLDSIGKIVAVDLACGSGTLLSASYTEIMDRYVSNSTKPDLGKLHKLLVENVLWGFDVLEYAVHLASSTLILRDPRIGVTKTNTYVLPLGIVNGKVYLGSLDLEAKNDSVVFPLVKSLYGAPLGEPLQVTVQEVRQASLRMPRPDIVIMNPPFARTGNVGKSVLFGYMPEAERDEVLNKLKGLGDNLVGRLGLSKGFGRAGLAAYFLLKSHTVVKDGGVLAFVLPRVFLSGTDWNPVREHLAKSGQLLYVVVSDDPSENWAWSENTVLSEILMIYRKGRKDPNSRTSVIYVRRRPRSALEAKILADRVIRITQRHYNTVGDYSNTERMSLGEEGNTTAYIYTVKHSVVRDVAGVNLNLAMGYHTAELSSTAYTLYRSHRLFDVTLPLVPLSSYVLKRCEELEKCYASVKKGERRGKSFKDCIGYDVSAFRNKCLSKGDIPVKMLVNISMETFSSMSIDLKLLEVARVPRDCFCRAGRLHVPGVARFWLPTIGVVVAYTEEPIVSQVSWTIPIPLEEAKIQALWLNTTPGLIHLLSLRQDSKGGFVQIKKEVLGNLLLIDTDKLTPKQKSDLLTLAERFGKVKMPRLKQQFETALRKDGTRYELDKAFLEVFGKDVEEDAVTWQKLQALYEQLTDETLFYN
jgi:hypothetical protein